jgi:S1-C subfamily serine protease
VIMQSMLPLRRARILRSGAGLATALLALLGGSLAIEWVRSAAAQEALQAVVQVDARIPPDARSAASLGTDRAGTGIVIDGSGLVVTIGYLILEASEIEIAGLGPEPVPASIVGYDHESGFGLIRAAQPLEVAPIGLGDSDAIRPMQPLLAVSRVEALDARGVYVVDRRDFAGYWEYLLEDAIFTSPPHGEFGGAALLDRDGRLVGVGSLFVPDAAKQPTPVPGNMFIPINDLKPIMADLLANGRRGGPPRPWLGIYLEEHRGRVFVTRVAPDGPAEAAGIRENDLILGLGGRPIGGLAEFYRTLWGQGEAGVEVPLNVLQGMDLRRTTVRSLDRYRYLRMSPTY